MPMQSLRHIVFLRVATFRGLEMFQLVLRSDDMGLDLLLRKKLQQDPRLNIVAADQKDIHTHYQIIISDCRRSLRDHRKEEWQISPVANAKIALIEAERIDRQNIFESGYSDYVTWPIYGPELQTRVLAQCRSVSLKDQSYVYSRVALVEKCCCYLVNNITENPTVGTLARMFNTNHNTLNALFKREMGLPPSTWQRKMRLQGAARQLVTTNLPINMIAERCGYELAANFATAFRRQFHISPISYRKSAGMARGRLTAAE